MEDPAASFERALATGTLDDETCHRHVVAFDRTFALTGDPKHRFNAGVALEVCGTSEQAKTAYLDVVKADPTFALAHNNLGTIAYRNGQEDEAARRYQRAIEVGPRVLAPRFNLAHLSRERYLRSGNVDDFDRAQRSLQAVLGVDSENLTAYEGLARLYYERAVAGDRSYALLANLVVSQGHRHADVAGVASVELWNLQGLLALQDEEPTRAIRAFHKAIELDPEHVDARLNAALVELELRNFSAAEKNLEVASKLSSGVRRSEATLALGVAKRGTRDFAGAELSYARALELDRTDPRPLFNVGVLYQEHIGPASEGDGVPEARVAQRHFERFIDITGGDPRYSRAVVDAQDRLANLAEYASFIQIQHELAAEAAKLEAAQQQQEQARREEILQIEREALRALDQGGEAPPAPRD